MTDYRSLIKSRMEKDTWNKNYNIRLKELREDYAKTEMEVTEDMKNILGVPHGAMIFALIDQAFAAASNSRGQISVALNMSITFLAPPRVGEKLTAEAKLVNSTRKTGLYDMKVVGEDGRLISLCRGLVYRKGQPLK